MRTASSGKKAEVSIMVCMYTELYECIEGSGVAHFKVAWVGSAHKEVTSPCPCSFALTMSPPYSALPVAMPLRRHVALLSRAISNFEMTFAPGRVLAVGWWQRICRAGITLPDVVAGR